MRNQRRHMIDEIDYIFKGKMLDFFRIRGTSKERESHLNNVMVVLLN